MYKKNEILFSIIWIIIYVVFASIGDNISIEIGIQKIITLPILIIIELNLLGMLSVSNPFVIKLTFVSLVIISLKKLIVYKTMSHFYWQILQGFKIVLVSKAFLIPLIN